MGDVPGTKVWVGNLGSTCEERDLRDEFSKFGELNKASLSFFPPCSVTFLQIYIEFTIGWDMLVSLRGARRRRERTQ